MRPQLHPGEHDVVHVTQEQVVTLHPVVEHIDRRLRRRGSALDPLRVIDTHDGSASTQMPVMTQSNSGFQKIADNTPTAAGGVMIGYETRSVAYLDGEPRMVPSANRQVVRMNSHQINASVDRSDVRPNTRS